MSIGNGTAPRRAKVLDILRGPDPERYTVRPVKESWDLAPRIFDPILHDGGWVSPGYGIGWPGGGWLGGYGYPHERTGKTQPAPAGMLSEAELRGAVVFSRWICDRNPQAVTFLQHLVNFVYGAGAEWEVTLRGNQKGAVSTGVKDADADGKPDTDRAVERAQLWLETWRKANGWGEGAGHFDPTDLDGADRTPRADRQVEAGKRASRDGNAILRFFKGDDGLPRVRWVEPELIRNPPTQPRFVEWYDREIVWAWGVAVDAEDAETVVAYGVAEKDDPSQVEVVPAARVAHLRMNVDGSVHMGVPDFFCVADMLEVVKDLLGKMGRTATVQAAIAILTQHAEGVTETQINNMVEANKDYSAHRVTPYGGVTTQAVRHTGDGLDFHASFGQTITPGPISNSGPFIEIVQAILRAAGSRFGAPEFFSGDASNNNLASALIAGGPFERAMVRRQKDTGLFEQSVAMRVLAFGVAAGKLEASDVERVTVEVRFPSVAIANKAEDSQRIAGEVAAGLCSPQTAMAELGRDPAVELANIQAHQQATAPPQPDPFGSPPGGSPFGESRRVREGAAHAPKGGVTVGGKKFTGGEFIPAEVMATATDAEKAAVETGTTSPPVPVTREARIAVAKALRRAVLKANDGDTTDMCIAASGALKAVYPDAELWSGYYEGDTDQPHTIAKLGGRFIDVTADQFGGPRIRVWKSLPEEYRGHFVSGRGAFKRDEDALQRGDGGPLADEFRRRLAKTAEGTEGGLVYSPGGELEYDSADDPLIQEAVTWVAGQHPRDKDGKFIRKNEIDDARGNPEKVAALRAKVRPEDKELLDAHLKDPGHTGDAKAFHPGAQKAGHLRTQGWVAGNALVDHVGGILDKVTADGPLTPEGKRDLMVHVGSFVRSKQVPELQKILQSMQVPRSEFGGKGKEELQKLVADKVKVALHDAELNYHIAASDPDRQPAGRELAHAESVDATGHKHRDKGPGGGQFASGGKGSGDAGPGKKAAAGASRKVPRRPARIPSADRIIAGGVVYTGPFELRRVPVERVEATEEIDSPQKVRHLTAAFEKGKRVPPIVVSRFGKVLDGHHRLEAAKAAGLTHVWAMVQARRGKPGQAGQSAGRELARVESVREADERRPSYDALDPIGAAILEELGVGGPATEAHGPPPHAGLVFDKGKHRWVRPEEAPEGSHAAHDSLSAAAAHPAAIQAARGLVGRAADLATVVNGWAASHGLTPDVVIGDAQSWQLYFATAHADVLATHLHVDTQTAFAVLSHLAAHAIDLIRRKLKAPA